MHPFLDTKSLTDEEIIERLGRAYSYLNAQQSLGHVPTVQSIKDVIHSLEEEKKYRMTKNMEEEHKKKYPNELKPIDVGGVDE